MPDTRKCARNPFPEEPFFPVPIKLYNTGLVRELTPAQVLRYATFVRLANLVKRPEFRRTLRALADFDGICPRRAHEVHPKLEERGMIIVRRDTKPYTYSVLAPSAWKDRSGQSYPPSKPLKSRVRTR